MLMLMLMKSNLRQKLFFNFTRISFAGFVFLLLLFFSSCKPDHVTVQFDSDCEVSGKKFSLEDVSAGLPASWDGYEYVVLEFMITTPQRFQVGFTTNEGYNEVRVMSYTPNGWNRLAIPLRYYREPPAAKTDMAGTYNQPRHTGWINLTGRRTPLEGVDSIGIRMWAPINNPVMKLRSVSLAKEDPGDLYLGDIPVVDEFGQFNLGEWDGKIHSLEALKEEWASEDRQPDGTVRYGYSQYGGYMDARLDEGTGFFRTEKIDGRWWFVDPAGYLFLSHGVNCVAPGGGGNIARFEERPNLYKELPPENLTPAGRRQRSPSFGNWNLSRRYGDEYREASVDNIITRMDRWGLNTVANWSRREVYNRNRKAFTLQLDRIGIEGGLMGLADVYAPGFGERIDEAVKDRVEPYRDNPWLLGYFTFNEPSFMGREQRLCELILDGGERPIKSALQDHLAGGDSPRRRTEFIHSTFKIFIETVDAALEKHDPNHLTLGIRFGGEPETELLEMCKNVFDVFSFNCYMLYPDRAMMDRIAKISGKPLFIGEYHFGTVDRGMAQSLWQVNSQEERAVAYRYYTEKAYEHPALIGTSYFQWCDQDLTGRGYDGENYNCGLVDVTDRPYPLLVEAVSETAERIFGIHSGIVPAVDRSPVKARGHGSIPELWNQ